MEATTIGIIGCGNISAAYLGGAARSRLVRVKSVADIRAEAAKTKAAEPLQAMSVDTLLADPEIEIVVNLTVPATHAPVSLQAIEAGKHVYLEKPLRPGLLKRSRLCSPLPRMLPIGCAPDTFLGAAHQACRYAIDEGVIGIPVAGAAALLSHGMEGWHPNPAFYYHRGAIIHDMGPYYVTQLVNLLGPVTCVTAVASTARKTRAITGGPLAGQLITVEVPTTVNGVLSFASGANVALSHSWDIWKHRRQPLEIYGSEGSMLAPDPNFFGGEPQVARRNGEWAPLDVSRHAYGEPTGSRVPVRTWLTIASSACSIWRRPSVAGGRIGSAAHLPCMCWKCSMHSNVRRSKAVTS